MWIYKVYTIKKTRSKTRKKDKKMGYEEISTRI